MFPGYHAKAETQHEVFRHIQGPNCFGVYEQEIEINGLRKKTTFFPDSWCTKTVETNLEEAYQFENRVHIDKTGFIGKTNTGMLIQFWLIPNRESGQHTFIAYPYIEETLAAVLQRADVKARLSCITTTRNVHAQ